LARRRSPRNEAGKRPRAGAAAWLPKKRNQIRVSGIGTRKRSAALRLFEAINGSGDEAALFHGH